MKLQRVRIENFKRFRAPLLLEGLTEGLNLFTAPNESGKSTVAEAIRAAFFERHRSTALDHLRPWGDNASAPTIELDWVVNGQPARLTKVFLKKHRCTLQLGAQTLDGEDAENHLAALLGFGFAGRGASKAENLGIPGLLWIQQGTSHHIADTVRYASHQLRNALGESLGELASTSGDAVLKKIEEERNELLTPAGGQPRGKYAEELRRAEQLRQELATLHAQIDAYQSDVDRLTDLRRQHQHGEQTRPWAATQAALTLAQQRLDEAQGLAEKKAAKDAAVQQTQAQINALRTKLDGLQQEEAMRAQRQQQLGNAHERLAQAQALLAQWEPRHAQAQQAEAAARAAIRQALQAQDWLNKTQAVADLRQRLADKSALLAQAQEAQAQLTQQQAQMQALSVPTATLQQLRADDAALRNTQARLDAVATTLEFELQATAQVQLHDGDGVTGVMSALPVGPSRQTLISRTVIEIAGVGRITVLPGGSDLDTLAHERERLHDAVAQQLRALGADSLSALDERLRQQANYKAQAASAQKMLTGLAPKGLAALQAEVATLQAQLRHDEAALAQRPPTTDAPALSVEQAQQLEAQARAEREAAADQWHHAQSAERTAQAQVHSAEAELTALCATLDDPSRAQRKLDASLALSDAQARATVLTHEAQTLAQQLQSLNLPMLKQDVERLDQSARHAQTLHQERATQIARLEAQLQTQGALGLEEAAADLARELGYAERRSAELARHAQALDHLLQLLRAKRAELARKLRAPLQKHLTHYVQILFPGAQIEVGEDLAPGRITRPGPRGSENGEFEELSVGAREQMGVVARLAYADLLQAAGKPTLLILDDALVHTDHERLSQMKRVLYDAAQRHQILVFSCHPEAWTDLGVAARDLG